MSLVFTWFQVGDPHPSTPSISCLYLGSTAWNRSALFHKQSQPVPFEACHLRVSAPSLSCSQEATILATSCKIPSFFFRLFHATFQESLKWNVNYRKKLTCFLLPYTTVFILSGEKHKCSTRLFKQTNKSTLKMLIRMTGTSLQVFKHQKHAFTDHFIWCTMPVLG